MPWLTYFSLDLLIFFISLTNMFADTPPTILLGLAWIFLVFISPIAVVIALILTARRKTRRIGTVMVLAGLAGAVIVGAGLVVLMIICTEHLSQTSRAEWMGTIILGTTGGFSLFSVPAALVIFERGRRPKQA